MKRCFIDLDGVLVDMVRGVFRKHRRILEWDTIQWDLPSQFELSNTAFWSPLGEDFWANLDKTPEFDGIIDSIGSHFEHTSISVLSSPCLTPGCITGKARWVERHLPKLARRTLLTSDKHLFASPDAILIDDNDDNCRSWEEHGGRAFLFPRPWNARRAEESTAVEALRHWLKETT